MAFGLGEFLGVIGSDGVRILEALSEKLPKR
jgi:hypothetical protein